MDYEQLYYDSQYEIKKLKQENDLLKDIIAELNTGRSNRNIYLQKYIIMELKKYKEKKLDGK